VTVRHWRPRRRPTIRVSLRLPFLCYVFLIEPQWVEVTRHEAWFTTGPPACDGLVVATLSVLGAHEHTDCSA
jgi:hypothetical protein